MPLETLGISSLVINGHLPSVWNVSGRSIWLGSRIHGERFAFRFDPTQTRYIRCSSAGIVRDIRCSSTEISCSGFGIVSYTIILSIIWAEDTVAIDEIPGVPQEAKRWTRGLPEQSRATTSCVCMCVCVCVCVCVYGGIGLQITRHRDNPSGGPLVGSEVHNLEKGLSQWLSQQSYRSLCWMTQFSRSQLEPTLEAPALPPCVCS